MKKLISCFILLSVMCCSGVARSQSVEEIDPGFVILDILLYRPVGFAVTVAGAAAFIGISPLTALASIPEPHDAFDKTVKILILAPGAYTFIRPVGDRDFPYHVNRYNNRAAAVHNSNETYNLTAPPGQRSVAPTGPYLQSPPSYPNTGRGL